MVGHHDTMVGHRYTYTYVYIYIMGRCFLWLDVCMGEIKYEVSTLPGAIGNDLTHPLTEVPCRF